MYMSGLFWGVCADGLWLVGSLHVGLCPPIRLPLSDSRPLFMELARLVVLFGRPRGFVRLFLLAG